MIGIGLKENIIVADSVTHRIGILILKILRWSNIYLVILTGTNFLMNRGIPKNKGCMPFIMDEMSKVLDVIGGIALTVSGFMVR